MDARFREPETPPDPYPVLLCCPGCDGRAEARPGRIVCGACGRVREGTLGPPSRQGIMALHAGSEAEQYPLWLRAGCCGGHVLWARNAAQLDYLEAFVGATLREKNPWPHRGLSFKLPGWMKEARNRDEILRAITRLRATLD